jgi:hypothetical protein
MWYKRPMTPAPRIGTEFAGYRIEGLLARGGMGVVYRAEHPRLGATLALKVMDQELAMDEAFRERFVREARAAARITHPNIVPIYDAGEWKGDLYIAMRYVPGDDLRSLLRKRAPLPLVETCVIARQVAGALDAAHRNGLVHRDVKPANILVEPNPDSEAEPIAYLADLGLTKHIDSHGGVTESGALLGTIDYMAPEQIDGQGVDGRADIYSLACVLYECLTGSVPFARENQAAVLWAHLHEDAPRASTVNPSLPESVDEALARGMAKSRDDRFATGRDLVAALQYPSEAATAIDRAAPSRATTSRPAPTITAARGKRHGSAALALAAAVGLLLGGAAAAGIALLVSNGDSGAASTEPQGTQPAGTNGPAGESLTAFDEPLLQYIPDGFRATCEHADPITSAFDATLSCSPGEPVSSVRYSHARSGQYLYAFMAARRDKAGLARGSPNIGTCSEGDVPSINNTVAMGLSRRAEVAEPVTRQELLGRILCTRTGEGVRIEWLTQEAAIYAIAKGADLAALYDWWRTAAGPEP